MARVQSYLLKLQAQGRLVIPSAVRAALQVNEGDEIILLHDDQGFRLTTRTTLIQSALGSLARDDGRDLTQALLDDRRAEAEGKGW
jgi:AbrB family transcriptional regulator, stage V sporulation protein T